MNDVKATLTRELVEQYNLLNGELTALPEELAPFVGNRLSVFGNHIPASVIAQIPDAAKKRMFVVRNPKAPGLARMYFIGKFGSGTPYHTPEGRTLGRVWMLNKQPFANCYWGERTFWVELRPDYKAPSLENVGETALQMLQEPTAGPLEAFHRLEIDDVQPDVQQEIERLRAEEYVDDNPITHNPAERARRGSLPAGIRANRNGRLVDDRGRFVAQADL